MKAQDHRAKAERIGRSLAKCGPTDYEMVIDGVMLAVTHWINFAHHRLGLTQDEDDLVHAYFVTAFDKQYYGLAAGPEFLAALEEIEAIRPLFVRGDVAGGEQAARRAREILEQVRGRALTVTPRQ